MGNPVEILPFDCHGPFAVKLRVEVAETAGTIAFCFVQIEVELHLMKNWPTHHLSYKSTHVGFTGRCRIRCNGEYSSKISIAWLWAMRMKSEWIGWTGQPPFRCCISTA